MNTTKYHILDAKGNPTGPFTPQELLNMDLNENTLMWAPELGNSWLRMGDVPKMQPVLNGIKTRKLGKQTPPPMPRKKATPPPLPGIRAAAAATTVTATTEPDETTKPAKKTATKQKTTATKAAAVGTTGGEAKQTAPVKGKAKKKKKKAKKVNAPTWKGESQFLIAVAVVLLLCALIFGDDSAPSYIWLIIGCSVAIFIALVAWVLGFKVKQLSDSSQDEEAKKASKLTNIVMQVSFWILAIMSYLTLHLFWMWPLESLQR